MQTVGVVTATEIPKRWQDISPAWVTDAIRARHPDAVVASVSVLNEDIGTTTRVRLRLEYAAGSGPASVFVKLQGSLSHRIVLRLIGSLGREERIYGLPEPLPMEMPLAYTVAVDMPRLRSLTLLEDLTNRGAVMNVATEPLDAESVGRGLEQLARLHAKYWQLVPSSRPELSWVGTTHFGLGSKATVYPSIRPGVKIAADLLSEEQYPSHLRDARRVTCLLQGTQESQSQGILTLAHGDSHVGNSYRLPDGGVGFYDFQMAERSSWSKDMGYFMVSALSIEDRRAHERDLLEQYVDALRAAGVADAPTPEETWLRYRRSPGHGLGGWMATLGLKSYQPTDRTIETISRFAVAAMDLDTEAALGI